MGQAEDAREAEATSTRKKAKAKGLMGMPGVGLPGGPQAGLPQKTSIKELNETIADLEALQKDWKAVSELKDMFQCSKKVEDALVTLKNA